MSLVLEEEKAGRQWWKLKVAEAAVRPPVTLVLLVAIIFLLLFLSQHFNSESRLDRTTANLQMYLLLLVLVIGFFATQIGWPAAAVAGGRGGAASSASPWGVIAVLLLTLLLLAFRNSS